MESRPSAPFELVQPVLCLPRNQSSLAESVGGVLAMIPKNCLSRALDILHTEGGYFIARKSSNRETLHAGNVTHEGLQHYSPGAPLPHRWSALMGFDGVVWDREVADAPPVSKRGIVVSAWIFALGATAWSIHRAIFGVKA